MGRSGMPSIKPQDHQSRDLAKDGFPKKAAFNAPKPPQQVQGDPQVIKQMDEDNLFPTRQ